MCVFIVGFLVGVPEGVSRCKMCQFDVRDEVCSH